MREVNITPLIDNDTQYEGLSKTLEDSYKCDWDDEIHDSYSGYVNQVKEIHEGIRSARCKAESFQKEVEDLRVDEAMSKADDLCKEAESV